MKEFWRKAWPKVWAFVRARWAWLMSTDFLMYVLIFVLVSGAFDEMRFRERVASRSGINLQWVQDMADDHPGQKVCGQWGPIEHTFILGLIRLPSESGNDCSEVPSSEPKVVEPSPSATYLP